MAFVHTRRIHDDIDFRLLDLVERLAADFENDVGIQPIIDEVQRGRDRLRYEHLDEADHLQLLESTAREALGRRRRGATTQRPNPREGAIGGAR